MIKRAFAVLLCVLLFLLPGCSEQEKLTLTIVDGCVTSETYDWLTFEHKCRSGEKAEISISRTYEDKTYRSTLSYDGEKYTLTEEDGVRCYKHLVYSCQNMSDQSNYDFVEYYLLSDDPEMTIDRYFTHLASSVLQPDFPATTVIYTDYMSFDRAENFGTIPLNSADMILDNWYGIYTPNYRVVLKEDGLCCYDRKNVMQWKNDEKWDHSMAVLETSEGGFVISGAVEDLTVMQCLDEAGLILWSYTFPYGEASDGYVCADYVFEKDGQFYTFGYVETEESGTDILLCRFSSDGQLLQEKIIQAEDYDSITAVEPCEDGFALYGFTQSSEGELPVSKDGRAVGFSALVTENLQLQNVKEDEWRSTNRICGWYQGRPIYTDDTLLDIKPQDRLPDEKDEREVYQLLRCALMETSEGYIVVRMHHLDMWKLNPIYRSATSHYKEIIVTAYDAEGNALWQTTSDIFVA